jgi:CRP-like cAMP-binding protein
MTDTVASQQRPALWRRVTASPARLAEPLQILLGNRSLMLLVGAFAALTVAEWGYVTALAIDALRRDGPIAVGLVGFRLFFAAIGSVSSLPFVEQHPGARTLSTIAMIRAVLVGASACLAATGTPLAVLLVLVALDAVVSGAYRPAQSTMLPVLSRTPRELAASAAGISIVKTLAQAVGATAGGLLLTAVSPSAVFAGAALRLGRLNIPTPIAIRSSGLRERTKATLQTIREPHVGALLTVSGLRTFVRGMWVAIAVIASIRLLKAGTAGVGLLMLAAGIGSLAAVPLSGGLIQRTRLGAPAAIALVASGIPLGLIAAVPRLDVAFFLIVAWGIAMAVADVTTLSLLYRALDVPLLPRVTTLIESSKLALEGFGGLLAPVLVSSFNVRTALIVAAVPLPLVMLIAWPLLRRLDTSAGERTHTLSLLHGVPCLQPLDMASLGLLATGIVARDTEAGSEIVRQGDPGDAFYVVKEGLAEVLVDGYVIGTVAQGGSFGERALLRDVPRTATVRAAGPMELLALSREDFLTGITGVEVASLPGAQRLRIESDPAEVLADLSVFAHIDARTLRPIAEKAVVDNWPADSTLMREGDEGDRFYVVLQGRARVLVDGREVAEVHPGDQLGEIALLHGVPRTATVVAVTAMRTLSLHRDDFAEALRSRLLLG